MRIDNHPVLGEYKKGREIRIIFDGKEVKAYEGEMIATALYAVGYKVLRYTARFHEPRGIFCAIGRCTDCAMEVNGLPNVRSCITPVKEGMVINTQRGSGSWEKRL